MNQVMIAGVLAEEPQQERTKSGRSRYWFKLIVSDANGGKTEVVEVVGMNECAKVLKLAVARRQQVIVYGAIHSCEGTNLEVPGKRRFVQADEIAPFGAAMNEEIKLASELAEDKE